MEDFFSSCVKLLLVIVVFEEVTVEAITIFSSFDLYHEYNGLFSITPVLISCGEVNQ